MLTHKIEDMRSRMKLGQMLTHEFENKRSRVKLLQMLTHEHEDNHSRVMVGQMITHELEDKRSRVKLGQIFTHEFEDKRSRVNTGQMLTPGIIENIHGISEKTSNYALDRTGDAGHKACEASFAPKAHRFPRSADGDARRSGHRGR